ncbi:WDR59 [Cordylochernes scorpioides]|uniref:WDR59 n=1 Tax=Cordylochernes scorpioides TaxID=51811 RepID=A0ABY6LR91_9ARAC|nr:WDR59 [Cordylochernes scorpioides]
MSLLPLPHLCPADVAVWQPGGSPYHTVVPADTSLDGWNIVSNLRRNRSNSWSDVLDDNNRPTDALDPKTIEDETYFNDIRYLDPSKNYLYDYYKKSYAEILYRWGLLEQRAQVLKHCTVIPEKTKCIGTAVSFGA